MVQFKILNFLQILKIKVTIFNLVVGIQRARCFVLVCQ
ncbi:hypothetical protein D082_13580 [Synechocystis sp. PCC 6714]|nr:hypothetical protein D082_13580 [Synechocystis sp. PCC 6714]